MNVRSLHTVSLFSFWFSQKWKPKGQQHCEHTVFGHLFNEHEMHRCIVWSVSTLIVDYWTHSKRENEHLHSLNRSFVFVCFLVWMWICTNVNAGLCLYQSPKSMFHFPWVSISSQWWEITWQCTSTQSKEKSHIQFIFNYFLSSNEKKRKRIKRHIVEFEGYDSIQYDSLDMRPINRIRHIGTVLFQIMGKWSDWFPNDSLYSGCVRILNCFVFLFGSMNCKYLPVNINGWNSKNNNSTTIFIIIRLNKYKSELVSNPNRSINYGQNYCNYKGNMFELN